MVRRGHKREEMYAEDDQAHQNDIDYQASGQEREIVNYGSR